MNIRRKPGFAAVLLAAALFLLQSCATIVQGTSQKIPVTSAPIGARVLVDGKDMGTTPLMLKLKRKKPGVIRIEQEGYNPHEIRITRNKPKRYSWTNLGIALLTTPLGIVVGPKLVKEADTFPEAWGKYILYASLVSLAAAIPLLVTDYATGSAYSLSPKSLEVTLTPVQGAPKTDVNEIGEARLRDVKGLRIRAAGLQDRD
jgi:hypothetical protein